MKTLYTAKRICTHDMKQFNKMEFTSDSRNNVSYIYVAASCASYKSQSFQEKLEGNTFSFNMNNRIFISVRKYSSQHLHKIMSPELLVL